MSLYRKERYVISIAMFLFVIYYVNIHMFYRYDNIDDAWFFSWIYNFYENDLIDPKIFLSGDDGIKLFFKVFVSIYGFFMKIFGYTKETLHFISLTLGIISISIWYFIIKKIYDTKFASYFVVLFLLSESYLGMVSQGRVESLGFLFLTISLYSMINEKFLISGFLLLLSFETHPASFIMNLSYLIPIWYFYRNRWNKKGYLKFIYGALIGLIVYIILHYPYLHSLFSVLLKNHSIESTPINHPLYPYFFETKYFRNLPDLFVLIIFIFYYFKINKLKVDLSFLLLLGVIIGETIIGRANFHYAIYFYPAFIIFIISLARRNRKLFILTIILSFIWLIKYVGVVYLNINKFPDFNNYIYDVKNIYSKAPCKFTLINPNSYFALYNENVKVYTNENQIMSYLENNSQNKNLCIIIPTNFSGIKVDYKKILKNLSYKQIKGKYTSLLWIESE